MSNSPLQAGVENASAGGGEWRLELPIHLRPHGATRFFAAAGSGLSIAGLIGSVHWTSDNGLSMLALGLSICCLLAILIFYLFGRRAWGVRFFLVVCSSTILLEFLIDQLAPSISHGIFNLLSIIAAASALAIFLDQQGRSIEVTAEGVTATRMFPGWAKTFLAWQEIETITADMLTLSIRKPGESLEICEAKRRLILQGGGKRIVLSTPPLRFVEEQISGDPRWVNLVFPRASAAAVAWTIGQIRMRGSVRLGRIEISPTELTIHRPLGRTARISLAEIEEIATELQTIRLLTHSRVQRISLRRVPNGIFLPEIVRALGRVKLPGAAMH